MCQAGQGSATCCRRYWLVGSASRTILSRCCKDWVGAGMAARCSVLYRNTDARAASGHVRMRPPNNAGACAPWTMQPKILSGSSALLAGAWRCGALLALRGAAWWLLHAARLGRDDSEAEVGGRDPLPGRALPAPQGARGRCGACRRGQGTACRMGRADEG